MLGYHFLSVFKIKQLKWLPVNFLPIIQYTGASFQSCLQFRIFEGSSIAILAQREIYFSIHYPAIQGKADSINRDILSTECYS